MSKKISKGFFYEINKAEFRKMLLTIMPEEDVPEILFRARIDEGDGIWNEDPSDDEFDPRWIVEVEGIEKNSKRLREGQK